MVSDWAVVRKVAEYIAAGERNYGNLLRHPDLGDAGFDALQDLTYARLAKASCHHDLVEPTLAFWPWLDDVRKGKTRTAKPPAQAEPTPTAHQGTRARTEPATDRTRQPRIKRPDLSHLDRMCVRVLAYMRHRGPRLPWAEIRHGLNAYRDKDTFELAMQKLQDLKAIKVEKEPGTRRRWVTLLEIPKRFEETQLKPKRRRHSPRSRGQSAWFQQLMAEEEEDGW